MCRRRYFSKPNPLSIELPCAADIHLPSGESERLNLLLEATTVKMMSLVIVGSVLSRFGTPTLRAVPSPRSHVLDGHPLDRGFHGSRQLQKRLRFCPYQDFAIGHDMPH
jgi:hypothetical protein